MMLKPRQAGLGGRAPVGAPSSQLSPFHTAPPPVVPTVGQPLPSRFVDGKKEDRVVEPSSRWRPITPSTPGPLPITIPDPTQFAAPSPTHRPWLRNLLLGALVFLGMGMSGSADPAPMPVSTPAVPEPVVVSTAAEPSPSERIRDITSHLPTDPTACMQAVSQQLVPLLQSLEPSPVSAWNPKNILALGGTATTVAFAVSDPPHGSDSIRTPPRDTTFSDYVRLYLRLTQDGHLSTDDYARLFEAARDSVWRTPQGTVVAGHPAVQRFFTQLLLGGAYVTWPLDPASSPDLCLNWSATDQTLPCSASHDHPEVIPDEYAPIPWQRVPSQPLATNLPPSERAHYHAQVGTWRVNQQDSLYVGQYAGEETDETILLEHKWVKYHLRMIEQFPDDVTVVTQAMQALFAMQQIDGYIALRLGHRILESLAFQPNVPRALKLHYAFHVMTPRILTILEQEKDRYRRGTMLTLWKQMLDYADETTPHIGGFIAATRTVDEMRWEDFFMSYQYSGLVGSLLGSYWVGRRTQRQDFEEKHWQEFERRLQLGLCGEANPPSHTPFRFRHAIGRPAKLLLALVAGWVTGSGLEAFLFPKANPVQQIYFVDLKRAARDSQ